MKYEIIGTTMPVLRFQMDAGEMVISEPGEFSWMSANIALRTTTQTAGARGLFSILGRALSGGGLFLTEYQAANGPGMLAFAARIPGSIHEVQIAPGQSYMIHKHGFLCASPGVQLSIGFQQSLGAGIFGGNGFILQKLAGPCTAFVELGGECVVQDLAAGETIMVHPGHIGMFQDTVAFEITMIRGIRNALFGGDGLFMGKLTGPGRVWLQSMPVPNLAHAVEPYLHPQRASAQSAGAGVAGGIAASIMGDILKR